MPDQIWADEGGLMVRFERAANGGVRVAIIEQGHRDGKELAAATLGSWRWDRAVSAMATEAATGRASSPLAHVADALRLKADLEAERDQWRERVVAAEAALAAVGALADATRALMESDEEIAENSYARFVNGKRTWNDDVWQEADPHGYARYAAAHKALAAVATPTHPGAP